MLEVARRHIARAGWNNVAVREADAANLPLEEASFDHVICSYALNVIPDYRGAIAEMKRVLVPGGRLASLGVQAPNHRFTWLTTPLWKICSADISHRIMEVLRQAFPQFEVHTYWFGLVFLAIGMKA